MTIKPPKKILVCQQRQLGDVLLTTPAIEALAKHFPNAALHMFTEKKCAPLLENNPHIHQLHLLDKEALPLFPFDLAWCWKIARQNFDLLINFQHRSRCRLISLFSNAPVRLSSTAQWYNNTLYTHLEIPHGTYAADSKISILKPLGIVSQGEIPRIYLTNAEHKQAQAYLKQIGLPDNVPLIILSITARCPSRCWPMQYYVQLVHNLLTLYPNAYFLPFWGPGDEEIIRSFIQEVDRKNHILVQKSLLNLREITACIAQAQFQIGNCSGPRHIAVAVDTPTLTILGASGTQWTCPTPDHQHVYANLPCQFCNKKTCEHYCCLTELHPDTVTQAVVKMFQEGFLHKKEKKDF